MVKIDQVELCKKIAHKAHKGQVRYDGETPHIEHVKKVVSLVDDETLKCIAWLHDVIEDTDYTAKDLSESRVSWSAVLMVDDFLTHKEGVTYSTYIRKIKTNISAVEVKIADITANLSDAPTDRQVFKYYKALCVLCE